MRRLWAAIALLAAWQLIVTASLVLRTGEPAQPGALVPALNPPVKQAGGGFLRSGQPGFELGQIMLVASGRDEVIAGILRDAGLDGAAQERVRPMLVEYMERVNQLRRADPPAGFFDYVGLRNNLAETLHGALGPDLVAALMAAFEVHGLVPVYQPRAREEAVGVVGAGSEVDLTFDTTPLPFAVAAMDAITAGQTPWLEDFVAGQGLESERAQQLRESLVSYMRQVNEIEIMSYRGVHEASQSAAFREKENARLGRAMEALLGPEGWVAWKTTLEANGVLRR